MRIDRRKALALFGLGAAGPAAAKPKAGGTAAGRFEHGVASGDPLQDRVVLWTRVSGLSAPTAVQWTVAEDAGFSRVVAKGVAEAAPHRDFTVKVDAAGLWPGRDYWYRFNLGGAVSPVGRARTLPQGAVKDVVLAFVTCSLYPNGYFNAYDHISRLDRVDAVVELGDYIYEYGGDHSYGMVNGKKLGRAHEPAHDIVTLADYRTRHAQYKRDPDLQAAHARCPWICVWDDHEVANDDWAGGAENHDPKTQGAWIERERVAMQAYYEWMPIREPAPGQAFEAINRSFQFGDLASLIMLESRLLARSYQLEYDRPEDIPLTAYEVGADGVRRKVADPALAQKVKAEAAANGGKAAAPYVLGPDVEAVRAYIDNPERQMLGPRQELWLAREAAASAKAGKPWQVLGNEVVMARLINPDIKKMFGPAEFERRLAMLPEKERAGAARLAEAFTYPTPFDLDGWNGYTAARERVYDALTAAGGGNPIVLSGDSHAFWVNELHDAKGRRVAVEFGTSSITSPSMGDYAGFQIGKVFEAQNPEVKLNGQLSKGYIKLTLTPTEARAELTGVTIAAKPYEAKVLSTWRVAATPGVGVGPVEKV